MEIKQRVLQLLERTGLTPAEAKFYLLAHQNPKLTIADLQKKTNLSKSSAYRAFERLKELGLLTSSPDSWRKNIEAVSLKTLAEKLAKEQRSLRKIELELKSINNLMGLTSFGHLEDGLQVITDQNKITEKLFSLFAKPYDHILCYGSAERLLEVLGDHEERSWVKERAKRGISVDGWMTEVGEYAHEFLPRNEQDLRSVKIGIDENHQDYMAYIYDDEVVTWHKDKELGNRAIIITDPLIVRMQQAMFRNLWKSK